jgi:hypothetical protein
MSIEDLIDGMVIAYYNRKKIQKLKSLTDVRNINKLLNIDENKNNKIFLFIKLLFNLFIKKEDDYIIDNKILEYCIIIFKKNKLIINIIEKFESILDKYDIPDEYDSSKYDIPSELLTFLLSDIEKILINNDITDKILQNLIILKQPVFKKYYDKQNIESYSLSINNSIDILLKSLDYDLLISILSLDNFEKKKRLLYELYELYNKKYFGKYLKDYLLIVINYLDYKPFEEFKEIFIKCNNKLNELYDLLKKIKVNKDLSKYNDINYKIIDNFIIKTLKEKGFSNETLIFIIEYLEMLEKNLMIDFSVILSKKLLPRTSPRTSPKPSSKSSPKRSPKSSSKSSSKSLPLLIHLRPLPPKSKLQLKPLPKL